jgi:hypothetical protein
MQAKILGFPMRARGDAQIGEPGFREVSGEPPRVVRPPPYLASRVAISPWEHRLRTALYRPVPLRRIFERCMDTAVS